MYVRISFSANMNMMRVNGMYAKDGPHCRTLF